ncbi:Beta-lactamase superfamily domain [Carpediemonas membranifera]|uniref:Beta-lactamase superfamily domain n=1 Tax=Carpediemonas membranifera TaxID=201153 RepID=A0A8J6BAQ4_9EUKA|nr:Beta-lactamase superfamily domain [Carpediemonas membranifera]|eukprot:KAG9397654.1 Beta-lactamase superfamily domain [Carpediemonas membranifera]
MEDEREKLETSGSVSEIELEADTPKAAAKMTKMKSASSLPVVPDKFRVHSEGGRYVNKWNPSPTPILMDYLKKSIPYRVFHRKPELGLPVTARTLNFKANLMVRQYEHEQVESAVFFFDDSLTATWLGHSSCYFQVHGTAFLVDPVIKKRIGKVFKATREAGTALRDGWASLPHVDYVLLSHAHADHFDPRAVQEIDKLFHPVFIVPDQMATTLHGLGIDKDRVFQLKLWATHTSTLDSRKTDVSVQLIPTQSYHNAGAFKENTVLWGGFVVRAEKGGTAHSVIVIGPSGYNPDWAETIAKLGPFDLAFIGIGGSAPAYLQQHHMDPADAVQLHMQLAPTESIATHWGTYNSKTAYEGLLDPMLLLQAAAEEAQVGNFLTPVIGEIVNPLRDVNFDYLNQITAATTSAVHEILQNEITMPNLIMSGQPVDIHRLHAVCHRFAFQFTNELIGTLSTAQDVSGNADDLTLNAVEAVVKLAAAVARTVVSNFIADNNITKTTRGDILTTLTEMPLDDLFRLCHSALEMMTTMDVCDIPDQTQLYWPDDDDESRKLFIDAKDDPFTAIVRGLNSERGRKLMPTGTLFFISPSSLGPLLAPIFGPVERLDPRFTACGMIIRGLQTVQIGEENLDLPLLWMSRHPTPTAATWVPEGVNPADWFAGTTPPMSRAGPDLHSLPAVMLYELGRPQSRFAVRPPNIALTETETAKLKEYIINARQEMRTLFAYNTHVAEVFPGANHLRNFALLQPLLEAQFEEDLFSGALIGKTYQQIGLLDPRLEAGEMSIDDFSLLNCGPYQPYGLSRHGAANYSPLLDPVELEISVEFD